MRAALPGPGFGLLIVVLARVALAATPVAQLQAPAGFERLAPTLFEGSAALMPTLSAGTKSAVLEVFIEKGRDDGAALVLGRVDEPLELGHAPGTELASAIASHLRAGLDLEATVERALAVAGPRSPRWEARALTRAGDGPRLVRFGFFPGPDAYYVLAAAFPPDREQALEPLFDRSFDAFEPPFPKGRRTGGAGLRLAAFGAAGVLAVVAVRLWLKRT